MGFTVPDTPSPPEFKWTIFEKRSRVGKITWKPPTYTGGAPITKFKVETMTVDYDDDFTTAYNGVATEVESSVKLRGMSLKLR